MNHKSIFSFSTIIFTTLNNFYVRHLIVYPMKSPNYNFVERINLLYAYD